MPTNRKSFDPERDESEAQILYTLTVEQEVGVIRNDAYGEFPALKVAFMILADYFAENTTGEGNSFNFNIRPTSEQARPISVTVEG